MRTADFRDIQIDVEAHRGALVFTARKTGMASTCPDVKATLARSVQLADYWTNLNDNIQNVEHTHLNEPAAIYGSGFYGTYIASVLVIPERIICFLDASPYQQEKKTGVGWFFFFFFLRKKHPPPPSRNLPSPPPLFPALLVCVKLLPTKLVTRERDLQVGVAHGAGGGQKMTCRPWSTCATI
ncbi:MAG: hypothetical protein IPH23_08640 [Gammaproteobacteria bacterium]|nr:hypothetical protein [Gammaproteobacteria bacterium]